MGELFSNFLAQMVMTIGMIILFGFLIATFNKMFYRNFGGNALTVCYVTGAIGTPVHELAHALMCVIFRHRIDEIKLFQISSDDGTLGYVAHSWNPKNLYQSAGNFFIGVAPILVISLVLYGLGCWLVPEMMGGVVSIGSQIDGIGGIFTGIIDILGYMVSFAGEGKWWLFFFISIFLALHMTLSGADIKGAGSGILIVLGFFLVLNIIFYLLGGLTAFSSAILSFGGILVAFLTIGLASTIFAWLISVILKWVFKF